MQSEPEYHIEIIIKSDPSTYMWGVFMDFFNRERTPTYPIYIHGDQTRKKGDDGNDLLFYANWEVVEASEDENIWRSPIAKISVQQYPSSQTIVFVDRLRGAELDWPKVESIMREFITRLEILNFEVLRVTPADLLPNSSVLPLKQPTKSETSKNIFRKKGTAWEICFQGCEIFFLSDLLGLSYIHYLLRNPNKEINAATLVMVNGDNVTTTSHSTDFEDDLNTDGDSIDPIMDKEYSENVRIRLSELIEARSEAEAKGDEEALIRIDDETESINKIYASSSGLGGKSREMSSTDDKARQRVWKAINTSYEKIALDGKCPDLKNFLIKCISTGGICEYKPPVQAENIDWILL